MKPTACVNLFEAILQFENINLSFPLHVLGFLMEDVITEYKDMDLLIEKIMYMENIDYQYNPRNIVTKMCKTLMITSRSFTKKLWQFCYVKLLLTDNIVALSTQPLDVQSQLQKHENNV